MLQGESSHVLKRPAMRLREAKEDRLVFVQRRSGWAVFLACMGMAFALTSLMLFQAGRDLPEWLAVPGIGAALVLFVFAAASWFSRRRLEITKDDPAQAVRVDRRTLRGASQRFFSTDQVRGVSLAARPSGRVHVLLLSVGGEKGEDAQSAGAEGAAGAEPTPGNFVFVLGGTEQGFSDTGKAAAVGARMAAMLQCPLLERGTAAYDAGAESAHVTDLTDTVQRPYGADDSQ